MLGKIPASVPVAILISRGIGPAKLITHQFKVDRMQIIVNVVDIYLSQLFISRMPKMRAIPITHSRDFKFSNVVNDRRQWQKSGTRRDFEFSFEIGKFWHGQ